MEGKDAYATGYKTLDPCCKRKGGFRATMFIYVLSALESMGFVANMVSLVLYFLNVMLFDLSGSANTLTNFMGCTFLLSLVGGFISDTYLSRLKTCLIFGVLEILALVLMTIQAHFKKLQPEVCAEQPCVRGDKAILLYSSLCLLALGAGGVRGALPALGGDQFNQKDPKEAKALASFFNWFLLSTTVGATVGVTIIVWIYTKRGWDLGFLISLLIASLGFIILALGKPFYRVPPKGDSPIIRIIQVIVVAIRNRKLSLPENPDGLYEISEKDSTFNDEEKILHTSQFRFLDKAAILREGSNPGSWRVCTVTQVEEVKVLTRMLPILLSTVIMNTCLAQLQTFSVHQGSVMNRFLGSFEISPASIPVIPLVFMSLLIPIYEFIFVPFARKITHHPTGITQLQRVGVGLVLSAISMAVAGIIEVKRRNHGINHPAERPISVFWLSFQYAIFGIADMFTLVGLLEFFYKEAPSGMRSLSTSFTWLSLSIGYFLSTAFVELINSITKRVTPSKQGWLHGTNFNNNNLNLFYWFLAILSCLNFANYLFWASWYKYKTDSSDSKPMAKALNGSPFFKGETNHDDGAKRDVVSTPNNKKESEEKQEE